MNVLRPDPADPDSRSPRQGWLTIRAAAAEFALPTGPLQHEAERLRLPARQDSNHVNYYLRSELLAAAELIRRRPPAPTDGGAQP